MREITIGMERHIKKLFFVIWVLSDKTVDNLARLVGFPLLLLSPVWFSIH